MSVFSGMRHSPFRERALSIPNSANASTFAHTRYATTNVMLNSPNRFLAYRFAFPPCRVLQKA